MSDAPAHHIRPAGPHRPGARTTARDPVRPQAAPHGTHARAARAPRAQRARPACAGVPGGPHWAGVDPAVAGSRGAGCGRPDPLDLQQYQDSDSGTLSGARCAHCDPPDYMRMVTAAAPSSAGALLPGLMPSLDGPERPGADMTYDEEESKLRCAMQASMARTTSAARSLRRDGLPPLLSKLGSGRRAAAPRRVVRADGGAAAFQRHYARRGDDTRDQAPTREALRFARRKRNHIRVRAADGQ